MFIAIEDVRRGDIIVEGRDETKVSKVEPFYCSSNGTHINNRFCYDRGTVVKVKRGKDEESELLQSDDPAEQLLYEIFGDPSAVVKDSPFSDRALFRKLAGQPVS